MYYYHTVSNAVTVTVIIGCAIVGFCFGLLYNSSITDDRSVPLQLLNASTNTASCTSTVLCTDSAGTSSNPLSFSSIVNTLLSYNNRDNNNNNNNFCITNSVTNIDNVKSTTTCTATANNDFKEVSNQLQLQHQSNDYAADDVVPQLYPNEFYESFVHPAMMTMAQERRKHSNKMITTLVQSNSISSAEENVTTTEIGSNSMIHVAIVTIAKSMTSLLSSTRLIQDQIRMYTNVQSIVNVMILQTKNDVKGNYKQQRIIVHVEDTVVSTITQHEFETQNENDDLSGTSVRDDFHSWLISTIGLTMSLSIDVLYINDPNDDVSLLLSINNNNAIHTVLFDFLSNDALIVSSAGTLHPPQGRYSTNAPFSSSKHNKYTNSNSHLLSISAVAEKYGYQKVVEYTESFTSSMNIHHRPISITYRFVIILKDRQLLSNWIATDAEILLSIKKEMKTTTTTTSDTPSLLLFDSGTMKTYKYPSRITEDVYCMFTSSTTSTTTSNNCYGRHGYEPTMDNVPVSSFEVRGSGVENSGRGVFALQDTQSGSYLGVEDMVHSMLLLPNTVQILRDCDNAIDSNTINNWYDKFSNKYLEGYAWEDNAFGRTAVGVDPGIFTFINHGCNGTNNIGTRINGTELSINDDTPYYHIFVNDHSQDLYNFQFDRQPLLWSTQSIEHIPTGSELLDNYLSYGGAAYWNDNLEEMRSLCTGLLDYAVVVNYEQSK